MAVPQNAPGSFDNLLTHESGYLEFCEFFHLKPFPTTKLQICRYMVYLSFTLTIPGSTQNYISSILSLHDLKGFVQPPKTALYFKVFGGVKRTLQHQVKK